MKKIPSIVLALSAVISIYLLVDKFTGSSAKKIGVVQMEKLVYDYKGMKDATEKYTRKMNSWNAIRIDSINKDQQKLNKDIQLFLVFKQSYMENAQNMQANAEKEDKNMTLGVVNQVNEYIKSYAKDKGYDLILCNTDQYQNVGFSKEQLDITKDLLEYANRKYAGEK
jgi:Skp family chaperone for outer membrane proteins